MFLVRVFPMLDVHASAVLPQRLNTLVDMQDIGTADQKAEQRVDGAILWASVLEAIEKIRLGVEAMNCAEA